MQKSYLQRHTLIMALTMMLALFMAACAVQPVQPATTEPATAAETVTVSHPQGETTVVKNPQRVVVFEYGILNTMDLLGLPVIAVPQSSPIPAVIDKYTDADAYANAGTLFEPDYEKINELKPDLIVVGGRSSAAYAELAKIAPTLDVTINQANFLEDFRHNMTNLGIIFAKEAEIAGALAEIDSAIARVQEKAATSEKTALIVMTIGGEVNAYGPGSRFGIIHDLLGVTPVEGDIEAETHGDAISFEYILEKDPDILFIIDRDSATGEATESAAQIMDNELIAATTAYANDALVYLDPGVWYLANTGLGTVASMIAEVEAALE